MLTHEIVKVRQMAWAHSKGICLVGSQGERGTLCYTKDIADNLYKPLSESTERSFRDGSGNELESKMRALHSSSALGVNVFEYWKQMGDATTIAEACGLCRKGSSAPDKIVFEEKCSIDDRFSIPPNIDVVIHCKEDSTIQRYGIECKFTETYQSRSHGGIAKKYFENDLNIWSGLPALENLARSICPDDDYFACLHAAQLIKHILGLKNNFGKGGFRLLYLWYDAYGSEGHQHHLEVNEFSDIAKSDGIKFHSLTYQELILRLSKRLEPQHQDYARYLSERYL